MIFVVTFMNLLKYCFYNSRTHIYTAIVTINTVRTVLHCILHNKMVRKEIKLSNVYNATKNKYFSKLTY